MINFCVWGEKCENTSKKINVLWKEIQYYHFIYICYIVLHIYNSLISHSQVLWLLTNCTSTYNWNLQDKQLYQQKLKLNTRGHDMLVFKKKHKFDICENPLLQSQALTGKEKKSLPKLLQVLSLTWLDAYCYSKITASRPPRTSKSFIGSICTYSISVAATQQLQSKIWKNSTGVDDMN